MAKVAVAFVPVELRKTVVWRERSSRANSLRPSGALGELSENIVITRSSRTTCALILIPIPFYRTSEVPVLNLNPNRSRNQGGLALHIRHIEINVITHFGSCIVFFAAFGFVTQPVVFSLTVSIRPSHSASDGVR